MRVGVLVTPKMRGVPEILLQRVGESRRVICVRNSVVCEVLNSAGEPVMSVIDQFSPREGHTTDKGDEVVLLPYASGMMVISGNCSRYVALPLRPVGIAKHECLETVVCVADEAGIRLVDTSSQNIMSSFATPWSPLCIVGTSSGVVVLCSRSGTHQFALHSMSVVDMELRLVDSRFLDLPVQKSEIPRLSLRFEGPWVIVELSRGADEPIVLYRFPLLPSGLLGPGTKTTADRPSDIERSTFTPGAYLHATAVERERGISGYVVDTEGRFFEVRASDALRGLPTRRELCAVKI